MSKSSNYGPLPLQWLWWGLAVAFLFFAVGLSFAYPLVATALVGAALLLASVGFITFARVKRFEAEQAAPPEIPLVPSEPRRASYDLTSPQIHGCAVAYRYDDVDFDLAPGAPDLPGLVGVQLRLDVPDDEEAPISVCLPGAVLGTLRDTQHADMVRDWRRRGDPVVAAISWADQGFYHANLSLLFYRNVLAEHLAAHPDAPVYRLTGTPADGAQLCSSGDRCALLFDNKLGKYRVVLPGGVDLGYLPASAGAFAAQRGTQGSSVFVAAVDHAVDVYLF